MFAYGPLFEVRTAAVHNTGEEYRCTEPVKGTVSVPADMHAADRGDVFV